MPTFKATRHILTYTLTRLVPYTTPLRHVATSPSCATHNRPRPSGCQQAAGLQPPPSPRLQIDVQLCRYGPCCYPPRVGLGGQLVECIPLCTCACLPNGNGAGDRACGGWPGSQTGAPAKAPPAAAVHVVWRWWGRSADMTMRA